MKSDCHDNHWYTNYVDLVTIVSSTSCNYQLDLTDLIEIYLIQPCQLLSRFQSYSPQVCNGRPGRMLRYAGCKDVSGRAGHGLQNASDSTQTVCNEPQVY